MPPVQGMQMRTSWRLLGFPWRKAKRQQLQRRVDRLVSHFYDPERSSRISRLRLQDVKIYVKRCKTNMGYRKSKQNFLNFGHCTELNCIFWVLSSIKSSEALSRPCSLWMRVPRRKRCKQSSQMPASLRAPRTHNLRFLKNCAKQAERFKKKSKTTTCLENDHQSGRLRWVISGTGGLDVQDEGSTWCHHSCGSPLRRLS